ncbi:zinc-binding dehydrogenase [Mycobacterium colombiense]|uniref:zinc-binding dehydrogenase n=1 Tax=Mycobacterium colombiense TaxID=339268 RepID=UPI000A9B8012|nr:zinc-binding dehydrogenase [Mycobacterium colombiense]
MLWPQRIAVVDYFAGTMPADSVGAARTGGGEHIDTTQGGHLDNEPAGDSTRGINVTAVYVRSDGAQLDRLTALLASHRLSMPTPRSCGLDQAASALAHVVAGHESNGVVITKDI